MMKIKKDKRTKRVKGQGNRREGTFVQSLKGRASKVKPKMKLKRVKMKRVKMKRVKTKRVKSKRVKTKRDKKNMERQNDEKSQKSRVKGR